MSWQIVKLSGEGLALVYKTVAAGVIRGFELSLPFPPDLQHQNINDFSTIILSTLSCLYSFFYNPSHLSLLLLARSPCSRLWRRAGDHSSSSLFPPSSSSTSSASLGNVPHLSHILLHLHRNHWALMRASRIARMTSTTATRARGYARQPCCTRETRTNSGVSTSGVLRHIESMEIDGGSPRMCSAMLSMRTIRTSTSQHTYSRS